MKMGIKEFRERISDVAFGDKTVVITHHGRRVGRFIPDGPRPSPELDMDQWVRERKEFGRRWRAMTPDWKDRLRELGEPEEDIAELEAADKCC